MIICAAIRLNNIIICGIRHSDCYEILFKMHYPYEKKEVEEGFMTSRQKFLDRGEAFKEAYITGQLSETVYQLKIEEKDYKLYSEDLY